MTHDLSNVRSVSGRPVSPDWVVIGEHTYIAHRLAVGAWYACEKIVIGKFCSIGNDVTILTGGNRRTDIAATYPIAMLAARLARRVEDGRPPAGMERRAAMTLGRLCASVPYFIQGPTYRTTVDTTIGHDVWVGYGAMITGGVTVGHGAVVASGSVVSSGVAPYAIVAGNPARVIRYRFSRRVVEQMLRIRWWDWSDDEIRDRKEWFYRPITEFVERFDPQAGRHDGRIAIGD